MASFLVFKLRIELAGYMNGVKKARLTIHVSEFSSFWLPSGGHIFYKSDNALRLVASASSYTLIRIDRRVMMLDE